MSADVGFRLLGPFEFRVGGREVVLRSAKQRALLAALLVEPGRVVSAAELTKVLWEAHTVDSPRRALHVCVTRTRATLAAAGAAGLIVSRADGYFADVPADSVDVIVFRRWLARADEAAERGDVSGECAALTEALNLWRGEPLADVPSGLLHRGPAVQLNEQRLQALERRIERNLEVELPVDVVGELAELTAMHPLRERLWALYMAALHHAGRRAEALDAYHRLRRLLTEALGVEPGEELQRLHTRILGGPGDDATDEAARHIVPRQLPPVVAGFAGREAEANQMDRLLEKYEHDVGGGSTIVVITGMAGVGKTALAAYWSRRVADRFPDGQLWLDLRGYNRRAPVTPHQSIAAVLRALGVPVADLPADLDGRIGLYRSVMDGRRVLLVLDNASGVEQVMPLLPGDVRSLVLITSRNELAPLIAVEGAHTLRVDPFTPDDARQMLEPRLGGERIRVEPAALDRIIANCYGLPLALAIVAARAASRPSFSLTAIERQLTDAPNPLDRFATLDVRAVLSWSYRSLTEPGARLFRLLGLHPTADVSVAAAACLVGTAEAEATALLDELAAAHLLIEHTPDRFIMHDLLRAYAAELVAADDAAEAALHRLLDWFTRTALNARPLLQPTEVAVEAPARANAAPALDFGDERSARAWFEAERDNLLAAVELTHAHGFDDLCWRLAYATWVYLYLMGAWDDLLRSHETALRATERLGDRTGKAQLLAGIGVAYRAAGRPARAVEVHQRALAIFRSAGEVNGIAHALSNLSAAYRDVGDLDLALKCGEQSYSLEEALGQIGNMAISLYQIGMTLIAADRPDDALARIEYALRLFRKLGHHRGEARGLQLAATARRRLGRHEEAIEDYRAAVGIYDDIGDRWYQAAMLTTLGDAYHDGQRVAEGRDAWARALALYEALDSPLATDVRSRLAPRTPTRVRTRPPVEAE
jgi:DNA-binding SARP family transcriptional activator/tetratricopeptide (TPR) repeat protein